METKVRKQQSIDMVRAFTVRWVAEKYNVTRSYVRMAITESDPDKMMGVMHDMKKDFEKKYNELTKAMK